MRTQQAIEISEADEMAQGHIGGCVFAVLCARLLWLLLEKEEKALKMLCEMCCRRTLCFRLLEAHRWKTDGSEMTAG